MASPNLYKEGRAMKWHVAVAVITVLCLGLFCSYPTLNNQAQAQGKVVEQKITVLNPLGTPPPVKLKTMASRPTTLDGKTIYLVDNGYLGSDNLLKEMVVWFEKNMPKTNVVFKRQQGGGFASEDPALWAEIKEKADAVIIGMGH
jgi:hypothetical protein